MSIWKPSPKTPLTAIAVQRICNRVMKANDVERVFRLVIGTDDEVGERMVADRRLPLISATGSYRMGRPVGTVVAERFGRSLLELGGNDGRIVMGDADPDLALRAVLFGAVGTAGQRCTSTRRLFLQRGSRRRSRSASSTHTARSGSGTRSRTRRGWDRSSTGTPSTA